MGLHHQKEAGGLLPSKEQTWPEGYVPVGAARQPGSAAHPSAAQRSSRRERSISAQRGAARRAGRGTAQRGLTTLRSGRSRAQSRRFSTVVSAMFCV